MVSQTKSAQPSAETAIQPQSGGSLSAKLLFFSFGSAVLGLAGLGFVVYQELLTSAQRELERRVSAQAEVLEMRLTSIQQATQSLAVGAQTLFRVRNRNPQDYDQLLQAISSSNSEVLGFGLDQQSPQLVSGTRTFSSYWLTQPQTQKSRRISQNSAYLQQAMTGASGWTEPTRVGETLVSTFSTPIFADPDNKQAVLGVASADVDVQNLVAQLNKQLNNQSGNDGYLVLTSAKGKLLTFPPDPSRVTAGDTLETVADLRAVWAEVSNDTAGVHRQGGNLVAHRKLGASQWRVLGVLPEATVRDRLLLPVLGATAGVGLLLTMVALWLANYLKRRVRPLLEQCDRLTVERGGKPVSGESSDDLEQLHYALRKLTDQIALHEQQIREETARAVQAEERQKVAEELQQEAEASEQEVGVLLEVVSSIEEGDLTVEAEVSDRATGLVADTLNRLRERLAETIARVLATAQQVAKGAEELQVLARTVAANTVEQAQSVAQGTALTEQVAASAKSSAEQVKIANQALQEVQKTVESAQSAITKLTEGIAVLQKGSAQIVQRMKTLGEFVGLAEQFVQDQSQIASLTQVLAINATLVAARAAEQRDPKQFIGVAREFEAIAEQVNALATQTNQGLTLLRQRTGQIQAVVSAVDTEVQSLGGLVAGFTSGVEQSATAFQSVRQVTEQVVGVGQSVTGSSLEIATAADSTAKYMSEIATLAGQTANLTATARQKAETMGSIAQQLLAGIRFFRLPEAILASTEAPADALATYDIASEEISDRALDQELEEDDYEDDEFDYTQADDTEFTAGGSGDAETPAVSKVSSALADLGTAELKEDEGFDYQTPAVTQQTEQLELETAEDDLEIADFALALGADAEDASAVDFDDLELDDAVATELELISGEIPAVSPPAEQLDPAELADFNLVLEPSLEDEGLVDFDDLGTAELKEDEGFDYQTPAVAQQTEQLELETAEDDLEIADFALALGADAEDASVVDFDDLELDDTVVTELSEALPVTQISAQQSDLEGQADFPLVPEPESEDASAPELGNWELRDSASPLAMEELSADAPSLVEAADAVEKTIASNIGNDWELFTPNSHDEPDLPMNSEFDALVAELLHQPDSNTRTEEAEAMEELQEGGEFAKDDFEQFMPTVAEDDGSTPFNIDFLVEDKN